MEWTNWHFIQRDGSVPPECLPCQAFELQHHITWEVDLLGSGINTLQLSGEWIWEVGGPGSPSTPIFQQSVHVAGTLVSLGTPGAELYNWWYDPSAERISTTVPLRPPIEGADPTKWTQRADGSWTNPAEQGTAYDDPAGTSYTDTSVILNFWWEGPIYLISLPEGAGMRWGTRHFSDGTWPGAWADVQIRSARMDDLGSWLDTASFLRLAAPGSGLLNQLVSQDGGRTFSALRIIPALSSPVLLKDLHNALYCAGWQGQTYQVLKSLDDGLRWTVLPVDIWDNTYSNVDMTCLPDGALITVATRAGSLYCKTSRDSFVETSYVGPAQGKFLLPRGGSSGPLLASNGQGSSFVSYDEGVTWQPLTAVIY